MKDIILLMAIYVSKVAFKVKITTILFKIKIKLVYIHVMIKSGLLSNKMEFKQLVAEKLQIVFIISILVLRNIQLIIQSNVFQNHKIVMMLFNTFLVLIVRIQYIIEMRIIISVILITVEHLKNIITNIDMMLMLITVFKVVIQFIIIIKQIIKYMINMLKCVI